MRRYAQGWTAVNVQGRRDASAWIQSLEAEGGTNIAGALAEAFVEPPSEEALGVIVFLTDGQASTGDTDPEHIAERAEQGRGRFRVFSFGIGDDVNTYLLDRLAERARGTTEYIRPGENIERAVGSLAAKIASPVLTDVALSATSGVELYDVQPGSLRSGMDSAVELARRERLERIAAGKQPAARQQHAQAPALSPPGTQQFEQLR